MDLLTAYNASSTHAVVNQDFVIMYAVAPLIALFIFLMLKLLSSFKW